MRNHVFVSSALCVASVLVGVSPAFAGAVSFVSAKGSDAGANNCTSPATPCRTFAHALTQTNTGGEIKALDPGHYGAVSINKSVTITGVPGTSVYASAAANSITVNAPNAVVTLRGIEVDGQGVGNRGIVVDSARVINIIDCSVRRVTGDGILIEPNSGALLATISDTISSDNGNNGIIFAPIGPTTVKASVAHTITNTNGSNGIVVGYNVSAMIADSVASNNAFYGFSAGMSKMTLARSVASGNKIGINVSLAAVKSFGDNEVFGNTTDVSGTVGVVPSK